MSVGTAFYPRQQALNVKQAFLREKDRKTAEAMNAIRDYRRRETWGNAFRRPHCYGALVAPDVAPPFVRVNAHGERYDPSRR